MTPIARTNAAIGVHEPQAALRAAFAHDGVEGADRDQGEVGPRDAAVLEQGQVEQKFPLVVSQMLSER
jgi:hypothetical protein